MMCKNCGMENALQTDKECWHCGKPLFAEARGSDASAIDRISPKAGAWCVKGHSAVCDNLCKMWCCKFEHQEALLVAASEKL